MTNILFNNKRNLTYTSCYCEENIWKLCELVRNKSINVDDKNETFAVFISSTEERVPFWKQKSQPNSICLWDYHVIFIQRPSKSVAGESLVYDLDTTLDFPSEFENYMMNSLLFTYAMKYIIQAPNAEKIANTYVQLLENVNFRVVTTEQFYNNFSCDRSHMINPQTKEYNSPPPVYPCIKMHSTEVMNLPKYRDMVDVSNNDKNIEDLPYGKLMDLETFCNFFGVEDYEELKQNVVSQFQE
jgi:hypothetical protein